jgi:hypothetical protein
VFDVTSDLNSSIPCDDSQQVSQYGVIENSIAKGNTVVSSNSNAEEHIRFIITMTSEKIQHETKIWKCRKGR